MKLAFVHLDHPCKAMPGREPSATWSEENLPGMRYDATTNSVDFGNGRGVPWVRVLSWHRAPTVWDKPPSDPVTDLRKAIVMAHDQLPSFPCNWCERSFSSPQALGGHKGRCDRRPE